MLWWVQLIIVVASYLISAAMTPKPERPRAGALEDFDWPQIDEGTPKAVIFGTVWSNDWTVLAVGNFRTTEIKSGGKKWVPGILPGTTNPIEAYLDDKWNLSGLEGEDPIGGGWFPPPEEGDGG